MFLSKVLKFGLIGLLLFIASGLLIDALLNYTFLSKTKVQEIFKCETLIVGDSHTQTALFPDSIPGAINISTSSESIYYTYNVLNKLLNDYQITPENIILGVSYHSLARPMDKSLYDKTMCDENYSKYFPAIHDDEIGVLKGGGNKIFIYHWVVKKIHLPTSDKLKLLLQGIVGKIRTEDIPYCGFFYLSRKSNLTDKTIDNAIDMHYAVGDDYSSEIQVEYLGRIIKLCKQKGIRLILLNTPLYQSYFDKVPEKYVELYDIELAKLSDNKYVYLWNDSRHTLSDSCFGDGHHLNFMGSCVFSPMIKKRLEQFKIR